MVSHKFTQGPHIDFTGPYIGSSLGLYISSLGLYITSWPYISSYGSIIVQQAVPAISSQGPSIKFTGY
jgi:hypothetical protein